ncbi:MAG: WG repeat-containing protein [Defluviitaleaceae bacterium]|nr:WG repeat-containing protein [Defluviitaleaceae bacterium]
MKHRKILLLGCILVFLITVVAIYIINIQETASPATQTGGNENWTTYEISNNYEETVYTYPFWDGIVTDFYVEYDETRIVTVDFMYVTNTTGQDEPQAIRSGDIFRHIHTLENFETSLVMLSNNYYRLGWGVASFSNLGYDIEGELILLQEDNIAGNPLPELRFLPTPNTWAYVNFPKFVNDSRSLWFGISNVNDLIPLLENFNYTINEYDEKVFQNVTIATTNFTIVSHDGGGFNTMQVNNVTQQIIRPLQQQGTNWQLIIQPKYTAVTNFLNGVAFVRTGGWNFATNTDDTLWGLIDIYGNYILEPQFLSIYSNLHSLEDDTFYKSNNNELIIVRNIEGYVGAIDITGYVHIPFEYRRISFVQNTDFVTLVHEDETISLKNFRTNEIIIPSGIYHGIQNFSLEHNIAQVWIGDFWDGNRHSLINFKTGELITPYFNAFGSWTNGLIPARLDSGDWREPIWSFLDTSGNPITEFVYRIQHPMGIGENYILIADGNDMFGIMDIQGNIVIEPKFRNISTHNSFKTTSGNIFLVAIDKDNFSGIIYVDGTEKIPFIYNVIQVIDENIAIVGIGDWGISTYDRTMLFGILDISTGEYIVPVIYQSITRVSDEYAVVITGTAENTRAGLINPKTGEVLVEPTFNNIWKTYEDIFIATMYGEWHTSDWGGYEAIGQKYGIISRYEVILPFEYDAIAAVFVVERGNQTNTDDWSRDTFVVAVGDRPSNIWEPHIAKWGMVDRHGNVILKVEYDSINSWFSAEGLGIVNRGGTEWVQTGNNVSEIRGGYWGLVDIQGNIIIPAEMPFRRILNSLENRVAVQKDNGLWGFVTFE